MIGFVSVFWSVLWRSVIVIALSTGITYGFSALAHSLFVPSEFSIKVRLSLSFLPAAFIFAILAMRVNGTRNLLFEQRSTMSIARWRQAYAGLAACAFSIVIISCVAAVILNTDRWFALRALLPPPLFMLFWIGFAIWQAIDRQAARHS